jgi:hypothetical protein
VKPALVRIAVRLARLVKIGQKTSQIVLAIKGTMITLEQQKIVSPVLLNVQSVILPKSVLLVS